MAGVVASMAVTGAVGGVIGAVLATSSGAVNTIALAASASPTPAASGGGAAATAPSGPFVSNEDTTHEQGESAAREAQENAGQRPPTAAGEAACLPRCTAAAPRTTTGAAP